MDHLALISALFFAVGCAPLAFFQSACPCCPTGTPCGTAGVCSSTPTNVTVTFTGYANSTCTTCANYNATWIVNRNTNFPWPNNCSYLHTEGGITSPKGCATTPNGDSVNASFTASGADTILGISYAINGPSGGARNLQFWTSNLGPSPIACGGLGTISVPLDTSFIATACTHDGSNITVTI